MEALRHMLDRSAGRHRQLTWEEVRWIGQPAAMYPGMSPAILLGHTGIHANVHSANRRTEQDGLASASP